MPPLPDPFAIRLPVDQVAFLDRIAAENHLVTRAAAIRFVISDAMRRDARRTRQQQPTTAA